MKIRDIIKMLEEVAGIWPEPVEVINNTSILQSQALLLLQEDLVMTSQQEL